MNPIWTALDPRLHHVHLEAFAAKAFSAPALKAVDLSNTK
jgi:hypothetical protein